MCVCACARVCGILSRFFLLFVHSFSANYRIRHMSSLAYISLTPLSAIPDTVYDLASDAITVRVTR